MIPYHLSTLHGFTSKVSIFGGSADIQHFVQKHKSALDKVIEEIRQKLCHYIKHIEDVLDRVTGNACKKIPGIMEKVYKDLLKETYSIRFISTILWSHLEDILKLFIKCINTKLSRDTAFYTKTLQADYLSYTEKLPEIRGSIEPKSQGPHVKGSYIRYNVQFTTAQAIYLDEYGKALVKIQEGKKNLNDTSIDQILKDNHTLVTRVRKSLQDINSELGRDVKYGGKISSVLMSGYISTLEEAVERLGVLKKYLTTMELFDVISGIHTLKKHFDKVHNFLAHDYKIFIEKLPMVVDPNGLKKQIYGLGKSLSHIIEKLGTAIRYQDDLRVFSDKIDRFSKALEAGSGTKGDKTLTQNIRQLECHFSEVRNEVDQFICGIDSDFKVDDIQMDVILREPKEGLYKIKEKLETMTKSYIKKLKAAKAIGPRMEFIEEKKALLSNLRSRVANIKSVDDGILELKEVKKKVEAPCSIAGAIKSLESTYHFEARTSLDIEGKVQRLMSVIPNILKVRSNIDSYIEFLEGIKGPSKVLERISSWPHGLTPIGILKDSLRSYIKSFEDHIRGIQSVVHKLEGTNTGIENLELLKSNIQTIKGEINKQERHDWIRKIIKNLMMIKSEITWIESMIRNLDRIGSSIEQNKKSLTDVEIEYETRFKWNIKFP